MGRKHREQVAGGVYHVYARGNRRADIFVDDADRSTYLSLFVGYIAHNPVKAGLVGDPAAWAWSSHSATVGRRPRPAWLDVGRLLELLSGWGGDPPETYGRVVSARGPGVTSSTSLMNVGGSGPPPAPAASTVRNR